MNMEYADSRSLSPEDQQALQIGKALIKQMELIYKGDVIGAQLVMPIRFGGGIIRCSLDTTPTKIETQLEPDDNDGVVTVWYHFFWDARRQGWRLVK